MKNLSEIAWPLLVSKLKVEGRYAEAVEILRTEANKGSLSAKVQLAILGRHASITDDEADQIVEDVEKVVADNDVQTHWQLSRAYELMLGKIPPENKLKRSFEHLVLAAKHGDNWADARAVANYYEYGGAAVVPDTEKAVYWYQKALERGCDDASSCIKKLQRKLKK